MTDIVFLLLLFFMLTLSSITPQALPIDLPGSDHTDTITPQVRVLITAQLDYYVDDQKIAQAQLANLLKTKFSTPQRSILVQMDRVVPVAHMVYVTDIAASLKATIAIATRPNT